MVRGALGYPTEPHPENVERVRLWRAARGAPADGSFEGFPSVLEWLKADIRESRARKERSNASWVSWLAMEAFAFELRMRIDGLERHQRDEPVTPRTIQLMRKLELRLLADLVKSKPF